nr:MFS transporter permease [Sedimentibacter acidaminivorans]
MVSMFLIALGMICKAFIVNEDIRFFLLIFFAVGCGLGVLRLFVNNSIKKMKGKGWKSKVLFFGVLLGIGLPFQSWFRNEVLLSMNSAYLPRSIIILISGVIFITIFFIVIKDKKNKLKAA